jgi:hypothetical protein
METCKPSETGFTVKGIRSIRLPKPYSLDRRFYRAMDQLVRLQQQRRGEKFTAASLRHFESEGVGSFAKQSQKVFWIQ